MRTSAAKFACGPRIVVGRQAITFCLVYDPAPGHSEMMSSFASLLVAKANATPEKVVPCGGWVSG